MERMNAFALSEILDLPEKLAAEVGDKKVVVAFDEFQDVADLSKDIPTVHSSIRGLLRKGVIDSVKGVYGIADPFFARYLQVRKPTL